MNLWSIIPLASCLSFAVLFVLVLQQAKTRVDKIFTIFLFASAIWSFTSFMLTSSFFTGKNLNLWNEFVYPAIPCVVVSYYHFVRVYNNKPGGAIVFLGYGFVIAALVLALKGYVVRNAQLINGFIYHDIHTWDYVEACVLVPILIATIVMLVQRYRHSEDPIDRNKTAYLISGWGILLLISYVTPFTPALYGLPIDHIGNLANGLIIAYTISRYSLLDIRLVFRKGLGFALAIIPIAALYFGGLYVMFKFYPQMQFYSILLIALLLTVLLALISIPLRRPVQELVDRFFYRETYDHRQTLLSFTSKMGNILNLDQLTTEMLQTLSKAIRISRAVLLFEDPGSSLFTVRFIYPDSKDKSANDFNLSFDSPVVIWL